MRVLLAALALVACAQAPASPFRDGTRTILLGEAAHALERQCSRASPGEAEMAWEPSADEIDSIEPALASTLDEALAQRGQSATAVDYYRQYAGLIIEGRRVIYVNGVHKDAIERQRDAGGDFNWRREAVRICDGGPITFGVEYDIAARSFDDFAFNGPY